jgi:two-component system sensor histidine kinase/response regulator
MDPMNQLAGRLLVVDDNDLNREMLSRRLQRRGFEVVMAADGYQAMEQVENENFDLVLLDIMMPGISGLEVLENLRKRHTAAELPVIMATAKTQSEDIVSALNLGANDYVTKPIDFGVLLARVDTHLKLKNLFKLKDDFLSMASHDLKNPLFVIVCQAYLIATKVPVGAPMTEEAMEMLDKIGIHAKNMQKIIADFLDFQAVEDGHLKLNQTPLDLAELGNRVVDNFQPYAAEKQIELSFQNCTPEQEAIIYGDSGRLEQVVQNLVGNALKFNPASGKVSVEIHCRSRKIDFIVRDTGPGLSPQDLDRVFIQFGKLSRRPTGNETSSGLGLAICKKLIDLHEGEIGARNNPEGGACFWFSLNKHPEPAMAANS